MSDKTIEALQTQLEVLTTARNLNDATDEALEEAIRDRMPLEATLQHVFPVLGEHVGAAAAFVRSFDETLSMSDFTWSATGGELPIGIDALCRGEGPWSSRGEDWTAVAQGLDVAGEDFGKAGVIVPGHLDDAAEIRMRLLLNTFCEELDNYLASIALLREKHMITQALSEALKDPILDEGLDKAIEVLQSAIGFQDLMLLFHHGEEDDSPFSYKVVKGGKMVHDSAAGGDIETDAFVAEHGPKALGGDLSAVAERFGIERFREEALITGLREQHIVGRVVISSRYEQFNTFDRDLLQRFSDYLRQRIVDFNREWKHLSLTFPKPTVKRLLKEEGYQRWLEPSEHDVAILYGDISGFTRVSEQVLKEPALVGKLIDTWSELCVQVIWDSGGVFDKIVGDCIIGLWGPPFFELSPQEACVRAARAALEIREHTHALGKSGALPGLAELDPPIGVATGLNFCPLFVGQFGPNENYTGFSSGMNNTARLQGVAERDEILCMDSFIDAIAAGASFGEQREAKVKNVAEPLVFRPLDTVGGS